MHWLDGHGYMGWMGFWWIFGAVLVAVIVWALLRSTRTTGPTDSPEDILRRRYAAGEIDQETYQRMLADLKGSGGPKS